jgi:hypothetical protein
MVREVDQEGAALGGGDDASSDGTDLDSPGRHVGVIRHQHVDGAWPRPRLPRHDPGMVGFGQKPRGRSAVWKRTSPAPAVRPRGHVEWDPIRVTERTVPGFMPSPRYGHATADGVNGRVVVFGGSTS